MPCFSNSTTPDFPNLAQKTRAIMKKRFNWLALTAIAIILTSGAITSANSTGSKSRTFVAGIVIGDEKNVVKQAYSFNARYTCRSAITKLLLAGFSEIKVLECTGNIYSFRAWTDAHRTDVGFHAISGQILYF